jgi:hypothetical protein
MLVGFQQFYRGWRTSIVSRRTTRALRVAVMAKLRKSIKALSKAIRNFFLNSMVDNICIQEIVNGYGLANVPEILMNMVGPLCKAIHKSREGSYVKRRLAYLNRQLNNGVNPAHIVYNLAWSDNDIIINSWESKWVDKFPVSMPGRIGLHQESFRADGWLCACHASHPRIRVSGSVRGIQGGRDDGIIGGITELNNRSPGHIWKSVSVEVL